MPPKLRSILDTYFKEIPAWDGTTYAPLGLMSRILENGDMVVGHLAQDICCENPLTERDDLGRIRTVGCDSSDDLTPSEAARALQNDSMVVPLVYDHDEETWSLFESDETPEAPGEEMLEFNGIWVPDDDLRVEIKSRARRKRISYSASARELAQECCHQHQLWMTGECYSATITRFNANGQEVGTDSCVGYLGFPYAEESLRFEFEAACAAILAGTWEPGDYGALRVQKTKPSVPAACD